MCIPSKYCKGKEVGIPRGKTRAKLASLGLTGKIRLKSDMSEHEILMEIRSVFSSAMGYNDNFQFEFLQSAGGGSKSLVVPSRSASFAWTAKQVVASAGRGCIYILAGEELCLVSESEQVNQHTLVIMYHFTILYTYSYVGGTVKF